jgi:hypothetical protein
MQIKLCNSETRAWQHTLNASIGWRRDMLLNLRHMSPRRPDTVLINAITLAELHAWVQSGLSATDQFPVAGSQEIYGAN